MGLAGRTVGKDVFEAGVRTLLIEKTFPDTGDSPASDLQPGCFAGFLPPRDCVGHMLRLDIPIGDQAEGS